jgi:hypothetical protein
MIACSLNNLKVTIEIKQESNNEKFDEICKKQAENVG